MKNDENTMRNQVATDSVLHQIFIKPLLDLKDGKLDPDRAYIEIAAACEALTGQIKRICNEQTTTAQEQKARALMLLSALKLPEGVPVRDFAIGILEAARTDPAATKAEHSAKEAV